MDTTTSLFAIATGVGVLYLVFGQKLSRGRAPVAMTRPEPKPTRRTENRSWRVVATAMVGILVGGFCIDLAMDRLGMDLIGVLASALFLGILVGLVVKLWRIRI